ncbi:MAG: hypothetical protein H6722_23055 [Sandaracinus sp.]|nr:hypothetical protein [Sandaracinus sp.]MCB9615323.1 hypothetical protein [Sandaracinus sp.]
MPRPGAPFEAWPDQWVDPRFGRVWVRPADDERRLLLVNQTTVRHATLEGVHLLHDVIDRVLARDGAAIRARGGMDFLHDWRSIAGYDSEARKGYLARMSRREPGYIAHAIAVVPNTPLVRMAVQTANVIMALGVGGNFELATDTRAAMRRFGNDPPSPVWKYG